METKDAYLELLALKNVTIGTSRLTWPAADGSIKTTGSELAVEQRVDFGLC